MSFPVAYHPIYNHPLPEGHRFPMLKYELLPQQLMHEGIVDSTQFFAPETADIETVLRIHEQDYFDRLCNLELHPSEIRKTGFPLSHELVEREFRITQGTIDGAIAALQSGVAFNIAGGTHHAYADHGEAFCLLNDQAIAAQYLLDQNLAARILIIDLDVHQGNGTAKIFQDNPAVFTFSMHGQSNYPFRKEKSDLDIPLADQTNDDGYLNILKDTLPKLIYRHRPDFAFYLSGVDILSTDKLGKLACTISGCRERDRYVFTLLKEQRIPVQCSMGGGYSPDIRVIIEAHTNTYKMARDIYC